MRFPNVPPLSRSPSVLTMLVFAVAAAFAVFVAWSVMRVVEGVSLVAVEKALLLEGEDWASVEVNGLQVVLSGTAPTETARFHAVSIAGGEVDTSRVIDHMEVPAPEAITPPTFSIEMLRNASGVSIIGLIPAAEDRAALAARVQQLEGTRGVTDLLETADYPTPPLWAASLEMALFALEKLPRSKISIEAGRVEIEGIADSAEQKASWERSLRANAPGGVRIALDISAPRPVITPFTLRFTMDDDGARFDACTAHTERGQSQIIAAGRLAGVDGTPECTIALGVPSPDWPAAVARGISALNEIGGGSLTFSDADVTLIAAEGTGQGTFDRVIGELEAELPEVFSLHAVLPDPVSISGTGEDQGPPEFVATLSPEGQVQLRGRVADDGERTVTESFARARFGVENVYSAMRIDAELPRGWSVRTLAGLEALSHLANGAVVVQPLVVDVRGATGDRGASAEISRVLSEKLGEAEDFRVNVRYEEQFDPAAALPTPDECVGEINAALAETKITFAPGSAEIELASGQTVDQIAQILKDCPDVAMEIGGYTDSQGREEMNRALSQRRAEAVLSALLARRVLTSSLTAHGYGEESPIADNDTEEGREANRRIEFRLIGEAAEAGADGAESAPAEGEAPGDGVPTIRPQARPAVPDQDAEGEANAPPEENAPAEDSAPDEAAAPAPQEPEGETPEAADPEPAPDADVAPEPAAAAEEDPAPDAATDDEATPEATETGAEAMPAEPEPEPGAEPAPTAEAAPEAETPEADAAPQEDLGPPVVVHPELAGVRPQPRPEINE